MKNLFTAVILLSLSFTRLSAQSDTLHIYYKGLNTKILDSNDAKIGKWAKSLNGKKVDIQVLAYYNDKEFKPASQERADELFLILNRKAREVINITFIGPAKGQKSQRSKVDIVFIPQGQQPTKATPAAKPEKPEVVKTEKAKPEKKEDKKKEEVVKETPKKEITKKEKSSKTGKTDNKPTDQSVPTPQVVTQPSENGTEEVNSAPTTTVSENEPLKVMVNGEWVEYQNGKKVKKKKK